MNVFTNENEKCEAAAGPLRILLFVSVMCGSRRAPDQYFTPQPYGWLVAF